MKILIADDHPLVRDALARTVQPVLPDAQILQAADLDTAEALLLAERPELVLLDLHMPGMQGAQGVRRLQRLAPACKLVVASGEDDPAVMRAALAAGALAFLPKRETAEVLQQAIRIVLGGGSYLPSQALADLRPGGPAPRPDTAALTPRQLDVLKCLMQGQPNKLIARELGLTEGTVKIHIAAILRALQARNRTEAVVMARNLGLAATPL